MGFPGDFTRTAGSVVLESAASYRDGTGPLSRGCMSFGVYLEGAASGSRTRTGFAQSHIAKHTPGETPDVQGNRVYRKKLRTKDSERVEGFEDLEQEMMRFCRYLEGGVHQGPQAPRDFRIREDPERPGRLSAHRERRGLRPLQTQAEPGALPEIIGGRTSTCFSIPYPQTELMESTAEMVYDWLSKGIEAKSPNPDDAEGALRTTPPSPDHPVRKGLLWRRDSKTRILATYYSILIVDRQTRRRQPLQCGHQTPRRPNSWTPGQLPPTSATGACISRS